MKNIWQEREKKMEKIVDKINKIRWGKPIGANIWETRRELSPLYKKHERLKEQSIQALKKKIRRKRFYYKIAKENKSFYGGMNVTADVFKTTKKGLEKTGQVKWQTASYKGEESEVLSHIVKQKLLPKEIEDISKGVSGGGGYYGWDIKDKLGVKISKL